ncbi:MAG: serine hydrolase [Candidatus Parcubacteria bacterium]|nr:serine hydrolase [Candidatus Parcubacteria bacterium]
MILDIILSFIILPALWNAQFNFDGFLDLPNKAADNQMNESPQRLYTDYLDVQITAESAIAVDLLSGKILYKKNTNEILPMASITKLMTALVFLDHNPGWQTEWSTIPADRRNGGIIYLNTGEILSLDNLFKTTLIVSDNDSAMALSRATGLDEQEFINQMNIKARQIGMVNAQFADPTGLKSANQATAGDLVKLLNYALQNEVIAKTTGMTYYEFEVQNLDKKRPVKLRNTDVLLKSYLNVLGGKTGSLEESGYNLAVKIKGEKNQEIIVVTLGSKTNADRFQDVKAITDWVYNNFQWN